jgi:hypothetical protein
MTWHPLLPRPLPPSAAAARRLGLSLVNAGALVGLEGKFVGAERLGGLGEAKSGEDGDAISAASRSPACSPSLPDESLRDPPTPPPLTHPFLPVASPWSGSRVTDYLIRILSPASKPPSYLFLCCPRASLTDPPRPSLAWRVPFHRSNASMPRHAAGRNNISNCFCWRAAAMAAC